MFANIIKLEQVFRLKILSEILRSTFNSVTWLCKSPC